jgi:hypothetical protein
MPKYQVIQYYTTSKVYTVDAENEDMAVNLVNGPNGPSPEIVTGAEFCDEIVEELTE